MRKTVIALTAVSAIAGATLGTAAADPKHGRWDFEPLAASAACTSGGNPDAPLVLPEDFEQEVVASEADPDFDDLPDMNTLNETGPEAGTLLYRTHEVRNNGSVSVTDLDSGDTTIVARRADWERLDGIVWTRWGTIVAAEEVTTASHRDPEVPQAEAGLAYEIDPQTGEATPLAAFGSRSHEGLRFDPAGNLYGISETNPGYIYRFTPDEPGGLTAGQLAVLRLTSDEGDRTGPAEWVPLDREAVVVDSDAEAAAVGATGYSRPEDVSVRKNVLYVAITGEDRVLAVDLRAPKGGGDHSTAFVRQYVRAGVNAPADFDAPDNLAMDPTGNLYITEDPGGSFASGKRFGDDIWVASAPVKGSPSASRTDRFATLTDCDAEPTGIYFDRGGETLYVNVMHRGGDGIDKAMAVTED